MLDPGLMVALAIGDAYGAGREFVRPTKSRTWNDGKTYLQHPKRPQLPGHYTDDTQFSMGIAEFMLSGQARTPLNLADTLIKVFKRDPRPGYADSFYRFLVEVQDGADFLAKILPHSNKSGGVMRAAPCGFLATPIQVIDFAMWQASLTHATYDGMTAAAAGALLVWGCRIGIDRAGLAGLLEEYLPGMSWGTKWQGKVRNLGLDVVRAALTVLRDKGDMTGVLKASIAFTGDTDTVASLALAAAAVHPGIDANLAQSLYDRLENGPYGRDYLRNLDHDLAIAFPVPPVDSDGLDEEQVG